MKRIASMAVSIKNNTYFILRFFYVEPLCRWSCLAVQIRNDSVARIHDIVELVGLVERNIRQGKCLSSLESTDEITCFDELDWESFAIHRLNQAMDEICSVVVCDFEEIPKID